MKETQEEETIKEKIEDMITEKDLKTKTDKTNSTPQETEISEKIKVIPEEDMMTNKEVAEEDKNEDLEIEIPKNFTIYFVSYIYI